MRGDNGSNGSSDARTRLRSQDVFRCPELDVRMKKYLVRLANETANHLIRDTLEPNMPGVRRPRATNHADDDDDEPEDEADGQVDARAAATNGLVWKKWSVVRGIQLLRGHDIVLGKDHAHDVPAAAACCLRGLSEVNASVEEFAMLFKHDSHKQFADHGLLFNPDLLDMATLYALVQPSGDHPRRYVGIKWCLVQAPSKLFRDRDFCYLECQKEFRDARGRRGWVRSMHSIKMPSCPSLEKPHGIVRASMYRCGLTAVESAQPGVLDVTYTVEMDLKGHFPELLQPSFLTHRIASLAAIDKFLQQQRLSSSPLLGDLDLPRAAALKTTCHLCYRPFSALRVRRVVCRKCGYGVCKSCSSAWQLDIPVIGKTKVRICTVCSAEARYSHATPRTVGGRASRCGDDGAAAGRRQERAASFNNHDARETGDSDAVEREQQRLYEEAQVQQFQSYQQQEQLYQQQLSQRQQRRESTLAGRVAPSTRPSHASHPPVREHDDDAFQYQHFHEPAAYEQFRPTLASRDTQGDPFVDEYSAQGMAIVRGTTDLTGLWDPREENQPAPTSSPASYFGAHLPPSFAEPMTTPLFAVPPEPQPTRQSALLRQPSYEDPPVDSYVEHHHLRPQRRRHTTPHASPLDLDFQPDRAFVSHHVQPQPQEQDVLANTQRRRQQSYPFSADQTYAVSSRPVTDVYPQQRHRQQAEPGMRFPAMNDGGRNFALEFFNEQYRSSNKPRATTTLLTPQEQQYFQAQQALAHREASVLPPHTELHFQPPSMHSFEPRRSSESDEQLPAQPQPSHQLAQSHVSMLQASQSSQTAGEVVEYMETPEGEWIEQRRTVPRVTSDSSETDDDDELLQPGYCIHCGSKRVLHRGVIESTCTCELGGQRNLTRGPRKSVLQQSVLSPTGTGDVERLSEQMAYQTRLTTESQESFASFST